MSSEKKRDLCPRGGSCTRGCFKSCVRIESILAGQGDPGKRDEPALPATEERVAYVVAEMGVLDGVIAVRRIGVFSEPCPTGWRSPLVLVQWSAPDYETAAREALDACAQSFGDAFNYDPTLVGGDIVYPCIRGLDTARESEVARAESFFYLVPAKP